MKLIISVITFLLATPLWAGDFYVLDLGDTHMKSNQGQDTIAIKRKMRQQYPGVSLQGADLLSVMMVAKTRGGRGSAKLVVGQTESVPKVFAGTPNKFANGNDRSYDRKLFKNRRANSQGRWQVRLNGNFKVRQLVVEIGDQNARVSLNYNHGHFKSVNGQEQMLRLRQKAGNDFGIDTREYNLEKVTIIGKSRRGGGKAKLKVGQAISYAETLGGRPADFHDNGNYTYDKVTIFNPKNNSQGGWQVLLRGNIKIKQVVLHLVRK